ncbi:MAG TPA: hypothetical protein ACFYD4_07545 [Candidatus Wunengus sp. YC61]
MGIIIKTRKHHNNSGLRGIKRGKTTDMVRKIAKKLRIPFVAGKSKGER